MNQRRTIAVCAYGALLALMPRAAAAHLITTGLGPLYDGASHVLLDPEEILTVLGIGLYCGLRGPAHARFACAALPASWLFGVIAAQIAAIAFADDTVQILTALCVLASGGLLAANLSLSVRAAGCVASALGLVGGLTSAESFRSAANPELLVLGAVTTAFVLFALAASIALGVKRFWAIIAIRVVGSWLSALGLLLIGWIVRMRAISS